jgi:hypothetical protein
LILAAILMLLWSRDSTEDYNISNLAQNLPQPFGNTNKMPICLMPEFAGQTSNRVIAIARALKKARRENTKLVMGPKWIQFYNKTLAAHDEIILYDDKTVNSIKPENCSLQLTGREAFYGLRENGTTIMQELKELVPRRDFQKKALEALESKHKVNKFISVHRRNMDGKCHDWARRGKNAGNGSNCTVTQMLKACDLKYSDIPNPNNLPVILFSDEQVPELDKTFPIRDKNEFGIQLWMMTQSEIHYAQPMSTVDKLVMHWRYNNGKGKVEPASCYPTELQYL